MSSERPEIPDGTQRWGAALNMILKSTLVFLAWNMAE
jgi:hypothetical protein